MAHIKVTYTNWHVFPTKRQPEHISSDMYVNAAKDMLEMRLINHDSKQLKLRMTLFEARRLRNVLNTLELGE